MGQHFEATMADLSKLGQIRRAPDQATKLCRWAGAPLTRVGGEIRAALPTIDAQGNAWVSWSRPLSEGPYSPNSLVSA
jgi:hypothetical protein